MPGAPNTVYRPWYLFPRIDNYGFPDPFGGFPKPDSNVQLTAGYPVTALLSGTVTDIDKTSSWGCGITIKLDKPVNSIATHTAYIHLSSVAPLNVGQHVNADEIIGYNGAENACGSQKVPLGFALYNGDAYGKDASWSKYNGNPALNPVPLLDAAAGGKLNLKAFTDQSQIDPKAVSGNSCSFLDINCWKGQFQLLLVNAGEHIAIFVIALLLIVVGLILLAEKQVTGVVEKAAAV
jgi:hypothetical protein